MNRFTRVFLVAFTGWVVWSVASAHPHPKDPAHMRRLDCEIAIEAQVQAPEVAYLPALADTGAFKSGQNNAFETIETFDFQLRTATGDLVTRGAYCSYDEHDKLVVADIETP